MNFRCSTRRVVSLSNANGVYVVERSEPAYASPTGHMVGSSGFTAVAEVGLMFTE